MSMFMNSDAIFARSIQPCRRRRRTTSHRASTSSQYPMSMFSVINSRPSVSSSTETNESIICSSGSHLALKKPRNRGFFSSLLCCFGGSGGAQSSTHSPLEENGTAKPPTKYLLPAVRHQDMHKKCVVIDLDETLVHSSFKPINNADFIVPVEIDGTEHQVYVLKRPYVDEFLQKVGELFECVLFTASLAKYADPVADLLDKWDVFRARLFRDSCVLHRGNYVKDLSRLGRELRNVIIIDNSPASYIFHPDNAVPVQSWFDDVQDTELMDMFADLELLSKSDDIYPILRNRNNKLRNGNSPLATPPPTTVSKST